MFSLCLGKIDILKDRMRCQMVPEEQKPNISRKRVVAATVMLLAILILALGLTIAVLKTGDGLCRKRNVEFHGCKTELTSCLIKPFFHCGDYQDFENLNQHASLIYCLCRDYSGEELDRLLAEYLDNYADDLKQEMLAQAEGQYKSWNSSPYYNATDIILHGGYDILTKPAVCSFTMGLCA
jgi:hypothetical protein